MTAVPVRQMTYQLATELAASAFGEIRPPPGTIFVLGDDDCYGRITVEESGNVGYDVQRLDGDKGKFIDDHMGARYFPSSQEALDDLNSRGFLYNQSDRAFRRPDQE